MLLEPPLRYFDIRCRIDQHGVIKVADFGLTEDMYARNYFRCDKSKERSEEKLPIRWMAPESIEKNMYTERTDVVRLIFAYLHLFPLACIDFHVVNAFSYSGHLV